VTFTAWRITKRNRTRTAFTGNGARKYGGRWNSPGTAVVYTAQSQSLAALEVLVHLDSPELLHKYVFIGVELDESRLSEVPHSRLPRNWQADPPSAELRRIGDQWAADAMSAVLRVPSALVPNESNFLLNPVHPDFEKLSIGKPVSFQFDPRFAR
jgi:RES domain-containing protein